MEWVETTGRTLEEAKDAALDQLGVAEDDAEFEVLEEARRGLFGLLGSDARVRARVRPTVPRPKDDRRDRRRRSGGGGGKDRGQRGGRGNGSDGAQAAKQAPRQERQEQRKPAPEPSRVKPAKASTAKESVPVDSGGSGMDEDLSVAEQGELARSFVAGLVDAFGVSAQVSVAEVDDDTLEVSVEGSDLGMLIGPKGQTLTSIQELARTVVQRNVIGRHARLHVDIAGYRQRRREALERFTKQIAEQVVATGQRKALEPMSAADRKVVHDTANLLPGVSTTSEGEEPRRRVVILPGSSTD